MKKFNLFNEIIITKKVSLLNAINSNKKFGINISAEVVYEPFKENEIFIYMGKCVDEEISLEKALGKNYQIVEDNERLLIKAFSNWQELIGINTPNASYDDTTADGVAEFSNKELENIGWQATEFNITYRTLVEHLEKNCDGTLLCIEQEEPYQFSGLAFLADNTQAQKVMFEFCKTKVEDLLKNNDDFAIDTLSDDEEEAARFFNCL